MAELKIPVKMAPGVEYKFKDKRLWSKHVTEAAYPRDVDGYNSIEVMVKLDPLVSHVPVAGGIITDGHMTAVVKMKMQEIGRLPLMLEGLRSHEKGTYVPWDDYQALKLAQTLLDSVRDFSPLGELFQRDLIYDVIEVELFTHTESSVSASFKLATSVTVGLEVYFFDITLIVEQPLVQTSAVAYAR